MARYESGNKGWDALALQQTSIYMSPALVTRGSDLWEHPILHSMALPVKFSGSSPAARRHASDRVCPLSHN